MGYPGLQARNVGYHGLDYGPVALWQLNGNLLDSSGNGFTLSVEAGTERYSDTVPGVRGFYFDGATTLLRNAAEAALFILGDVTVEIVCTSYRTSLAASFSDIVGHAATGETQAANYAYAMELAGTSVQVGHEHGSGVDDFYNPGFALLCGSPNHVAFTRTSNVYQVYLNGDPVGPPSSAFTPPNGGTSGRLRLGSFAAVVFPWIGVLSSVKILDKSLSASSLKDEYNRTLGPICGFR